jgi:hypothetical protein
MHTTLQSLLRRENGNLYSLYEEFGSKMLYIHFCEFEKNAVKVWNLQGNALEKIYILPHKIKLV